MPKPKSKKRYVDIATFKPIPLEVIRARARQDAKYGGDDPDVSDGPPNQNLEVHLPHWVFERPGKRIHQQMTDAETGLNDTLRGEVKCVEEIRDSMHRSKVGKNELPKKEDDEGKDRVD